MKLHGNYSAILIDSGNGWIENREDYARCVAFKSHEISLCSVSGQTSISSGDRVEIISDDPLTVLDGFLKEGYIAVGYISYEFSGMTVQSFSPSGTKEGHRLPDINLLLYKRENITSMNYKDLIESTQRHDIIRKTDRTLSYPTSSHLCPNMTKEQYINMVQKGKSYIRQGDIYQINLSQRFTTRINRDPFECFLDFYKVQPVPFGCYINFGNFQLISGSMELFLRRRGMKLTTRPIKGTAKRGGTDEIDTILKAKLISSDKERAENLMIVDLMRNDLGRVCAPGSVIVNKLFEIETYTTLHQLVSEVEGNLSKNHQASQIVRGVFPPGSVTGAPKKRTLEIIDELEPHLRGPYCGAIGVFYPDGDFTLSVAIRIMTVRSGKADIYVGGGIVWDSEPEKEYNETLLKSKALTKSLGISAEMG